MKHHTVHFLHFRWTDRIFFYGKWAVVNHGLETTVPLFFDLRSFNIAARTASNYHPFVRSDNTHTHSAFYCHSASSDTLILHTLNATRMFGTAPATLIAHSTPSLHYNSTLNTTHTLSQPLLALLLHHTV